MATCFGPPPLPPNKKSLLDVQSGARLNQKRTLKHRELASTYLSFPEDDVVVVASEDLEVEFITSKKNQQQQQHQQQLVKFGTHSLSRKAAMAASTKTVPLSLLSRSHSDSNLSDRRRDARTSVFTATGTLNRCLRALGSSWKNLLQLGGMSRPPKPAPQVKKVAPPAVPDVFRHSGSSFGSAGYSSSSEDGFLTPADTQPPREGCDHGEVYAMAGKSPGPQFNYPAFTFPGPQGVQYTQLMHAGKGAAYYHHQLSLQEDQGIDMTQSPGRDSPGSSGSGSGSGSRHSTASLDSGRASGYHLLGPGGPRGSTMGGLSSSPRCSLSSSSLGSSEHGGPGARAERLLHQGVPDQDVLHTWLMDLHFEEYFPLFASAGYDMPTICRMTPEDLTAIGIKKPNHRKKLKAEIAQLSISDGLPDYIPGSMEEWLRLLRLEEYGPALHQQGYQTVEDVTQLTWEDLEDIGIVKLGHQKKILLAIKRVKDVRAGKRFPLLQTAGLDLNRLPPHPGQTQEVLIATAGGGLNSPDEGDCFPPNVHTTFHTFHQPWELEGSQQMSSSFGHVFSTNTTTAPQFFQPMYCPDIVPIKIRGGRGKSLESLEDSSERTHHTFSAENTQTFYYHQQMAPGPGGWRPRSYDDGDITPTNEAVALHEGGGTLPRPRGLVRPRPVAKITAKTREGSTFAVPDFEKPSFCGTYKSLPRDLIDISKYNLEQYSGVHYTSELPPAGNESPRCTPKKRPPSPPKRQSSRASDLGVDIRTNSSDVVIDCSGPVPKASDSRNQTTVTVDLHSTTSSPLSLPAYPSSDELALSGDTEDELPLPPPPAPSSPLGLREKFEGLSTMSRSWSTMPTSCDSHSTSSVEQELIATLAMQQGRNGSDASFKSSSSTESDSLPFANENAGTIKQRATRPHPTLSTMDYPNTEYVPPKRVQHPQGDLAASQKALRERYAYLKNLQPGLPPTAKSATQEPADVLNDIGNMLANLTDELDAMLEEEKRQGLNQ